MKIFYTLILSFLFLSMHGQELIAGTYEFQSDPAKKYTLYVPSSYSEGTDINMMVGLHPLNTSRWNANSWCDTLKTFAETNNLLLVCPDGGVDGRVDDAIDTAFTTFLIDEVISQYTIDENNIYAVGFSWGAKTVYTYGLQHADRFAGFIPVGAAVNSSEGSLHVDKAANKKFYVIHGSNDSPNVRFDPIVNLLDDTHCVESLLLSGVGHTIDFAQRNERLTTAYQHLLSTNCGATSTEEDIQTQADILVSNVFQPSQIIVVSEPYLGQQLTIHTLQGQKVASGQSGNLKAPATVGTYVITTSAGASQKLVVR